MAQIDLKNATIFFRDGSGTPKELEIKIGEGNLSYSEKKPREYKKDRGSVTSGTVRDGDEEPIEVTIDLIWEFLRSAGGTVTPEEALKKVGGASGWTTSGADSCEPYAIDIVIKYEPPCSNTLDELIVLPEFRYESLDHDAKAGTLSVKGKCKAIEAEVTRTAIT